MALFPFHFWLPDVHPIVPAPISSILSGLLTKIGIYCIIRLLFIVFYPYKYYFLPILFILSLCTIIIGSIGSVSQTNVKKILAYSTISQIGFIVCCLSLNTFNSIFTSIIYLLSHSISKSILFLSYGGETSIQKVNCSLFYSYFFFIGSMSLSGFPPFLGFFSKYLLFKSVIEINNIFLLVFLSVASIFTLYYTFNTWINTFKNNNIKKNYLIINNYRNKSFLSIFSIISLSLIILYFGLFPNSLFSIIELVTIDIFVPEFYIELITKRYI